MCPKTTFIVVTACLLLRVHQYYFLYIHICQLVFQQVIHLSSYLYCTCACFNFVCFTKIIPLNHATVSFKHMKWVNYSIDAVNAYSTFPLFYGLGHVSRVNCAGTSTCACMHVVPVSIEYRYTAAQYIDRIVLYMCP